MRRAVLRIECFEMTEGFDPLQASTVRGVAGGFAAGVLVTLLL